MSFGSRLLPALALSTLVATSAGAVVPLQMTVSASPAAATSAAGTALRPAVNGSVANNVSLAIAAVNISQFDSTMGILLGATVNVSGVATAAKSRVQATIPTSGSGRTATSTVTLNGSVSGTGFTTISNASAVATRTCNTTTGNVCSQTLATVTTTAGATLAGSAAVASGSLASYYGAGNVALNRGAAGTVQITNGLRATNGTATGTYSMTGGTYGITYDYISFASPSFDGVFPSISSILDFGIINPNNGPVTLNFSLFNIGNDNSAGLSLVSIARDDNTSAFTSDVATFLNLVGGDVNGFSVTFAPTQRGSFSDRFRFVLADYVPAGAVGGQTYALDLTVIGATIPEPATWATLMIGFGMVGVAVRARRKQAISA